MTIPSSRPPFLLIFLAFFGAAGAISTWFVFGPSRFFGNWIIGFLFLLTIGLGALFIVAVEHVAASHWSVPLRRVPERLAGLTLWTAPLALVALFSLPILYSWTFPEAAADPFVGGKLVWLNIPMFSGRVVVSYLLWGLSYWLLCRSSLKQDQSKDPKATVKARKWAPLVLVIFAFSLTNIAFDWISSLEPLWYSDIFGVYLFAGTFLAGLASSAIGLAWLKGRGRLTGIKPDHVYNLGGYLFAFTVFWSYIAFAQYMLQWYANMPEEVFWYQARTEGFWKGYVIVMGLVHFVLPFILLVSRQMKENITWLSRVAVIVLAAHFLDLFWMIYPSAVPGQTPSWPEVSFVLLFAAIGLLWGRWAMGKGEDMPVGDPMLETGLDFHLQD